MGGLECPCDPPQPSLTPPALCPHSFALLLGLIPARNLLLEPSQVLIPADLDLSEKRG